MATSSSSAFQAAKHNRRVRTGCFKITKRVESMAVGRWRRCILVVGGALRFIWIYRGLAVGCIQLYRVPCKSYVLCAQTMPFAQGHVLHIERPPTPQLTAPQDQKRKSLDFPRLRTRSPHWARRSDTIESGCPDSEPSGVRGPSSGSRPCCFPISRSSEASALTARDREKGGQYRTIWGAGNQHRASSLQTPTAPSI